MWWDTGNHESKWVSQPYHYVRLAEFDENMIYLYQAEKTTVQARQMMKVLKKKIVIQD